jgi:amino acid adenylation domain-containing protein
MKGQRTGLSKIARKSPQKDVGKTECPVFACIGDLLAYYGRNSPDRPAILATGGAALTYGAFWARTNEIVGQLRDFGLGRSGRVAVVLPSGPEAAVATIAVAAGAVCVPLHPDFAAAEWRQYFEDLRVEALLTRSDVDSASRSVAYSLGIPVIDLSPQPGEGPGAFSLVCPTERRAVIGELAASDDDAFMLLTSGTTSRPKLVPLTQSSVCLSAHNVGTVLGLQAQDRLLNVLPLFHGHGLISGLLAALAAGSSVVCPPRFDADAFFGWLTKCRPTWYTAVPPIHRALISAARRRKRGLRQSSLRLIRSASSSLPTDVLVELEALFGVPVIETYGMTEAATQIAANPLEQRKPGSVGKPAGAEISVMDSEGRQLLTGEHGEIALRGPTITRGYDNNEVATRSAFRDGWFRTGDLGYVDPEGYLFLIGRIKKADVINRGGQKVSPAEVEKILLSHPEVAEAAAFPITHTGLGEDVAAAVVLRAEARTSSQQLRRFAGEHLARFKVPGLIRIVPSIPAGPGGKIIRGELATMLSITAPRSRIERNEKSVAPRSEAEWQLAKIWAELLELNEVGIDEDVFALGADSLTVTQLLSRLRARFEVDFSFRDIFDAPTVATLAARIESSKKGRSISSTCLRNIPTDSRGLLSQQQQRIYVLSTTDPIGHKYHVVDAAHLSGPLDLDALTASIATISERHEALRSIFLERLGEPRQTVTTVRPRVERLDLRPLPEHNRVAAIQSQTMELLRQSFDIEREPPIRLQLLRLGEQDHALLIKLHHLITDGWSQRLFWEELETLYNAKTKALSARLPELQVQYRYFVDWQRAWLRTPAAEQQLSYWRERLKGLAELPLRTDRPRPETRTGRGARLPLKLSRALSGRIKSLSRTHNVTLFMTLLAAFQCLLYRYTHHEDIGVGSLIANRNQIEIERLIGMFANAIVLRTNLSGDPTFSELLRRVQQTTLDAYRNQDLPIEEIFRALQVPRSLDRNALFQVMFILQKHSSRGLSLSGLSANFVRVDPGVARCDLLLELIEEDGRLGGWLEYSTDLFEARTVTRMAAHFRTLLESIVADPEQRISLLPLLPISEWKQVVAGWDKTTTGPPRFDSFSERFDRQVEYTPNASAVSIGRARLSYLELASRVSAIAGRLYREDLRRDEVVILLAERGIEFLAAMIAVQRTGGAFLPLDPTLPAARLAQIIQHSAARVILTTQDGAAGLQAALSGLRNRKRPRVLVFEKLNTPPFQDAIPPARRAPSSLACVIYTSGSTGVPKGAMIEQRGMFNHLLSKISDLELSSSDVVAQTSPQSFVISVWQFLAAPIVGARVHICADEVVRDPALLMQEISREGITVLQIVPALLREILRKVPDEAAFHPLGRLRALISTGESLAPDLCRDWFRHFPDVPIINAYGTTETSDDVATYRLTAPPISTPTVPIGRAIANTRLYVVDSHLQPVPIGVAGELYVGGIGVGRGYLNDPEQTRRRFLRDPFSKRPGARLYRTGDLARWQADLTLECLGRVDRQIKIRGCRVEVEEIEHVLTEHSKVQSAAVVARDFNGEVQLVAYIAAAAEQQPKANELSDFLKTRFPAHMIPAGYFFLDHMPLTPHGKLDRPALAAIRAGLTRAESEPVAPRNSTETILASIWADMLEVKEIGVFSNFFDLGGHSLLAGRVLARVTDIFGVSLPIRALFEATTVEKLAQLVDEACATRPKEPRLQTAPVEGNGSRAVSIAQERVLEIERELPGLPQFNLPFAYHLQGPLNIAALQESLAEAVRRHESLHTGFAWMKRRPVAVLVSPADIDLRLVVQNLAAGIATGSKRAKELLLKKAELQAQQEAWRPFEMSRAPLFRTSLLRLGHDDHIWLLTLHHIIVDGWSIGVFFEEVSEIYSALVSGRQGRLPEQALQFSDFAKWQRRWCTGPSASRQIAYWRDHLRGAEPIFYKNGSAAGARPGSGTAHEPVHLPTDLVARLSALGRSQDGTLFMTLLAGFKVMLLARNGCGRDICIATMMANRSELWTERIIGPIGNTTLIRTRLDPDLSFRKALARVREAVLEAYARQNLPFEVLASRLAEEEGVDPASLTQVFFVLQNAVRQPLELRNLAVRSFGNTRDGQAVLPIDRTWLTLMLKEGPSGIAGSCAYKDGLFGTDTIQQWMADYQAVLAKAVADPERSIGRLIVD